MKKNKNYVDGSMNGWINTTFTLSTLKCNPVFALTYVNIIAKNRINAGREWGK